ncbi:uncharacterized protein IUM83_09124 [Phytophthora cinnamomi]|uniref:uncharacterized protein n=1 Tax=Phytophthora cinnamomi TaxID=4785 RepID=UPI003559AF00|nr:hypothetical protein IUM83_09124 [Phytophthora cinnamomi]
MSRSALTWPTWFLSTMALFSSDLSAKISPLSRLRTSRTSPKAPRPITASGWKSPTARRLRWWRRLCSSFERSSWRYCSFLRSVRRSAAICCSSVLRRSRLSSRSRFMVAYFCSRYALVALAFSRVELEIMESAACLACPAFSLEPGLSDS